ncbi:MAG TPA: DNA polymerase ligase N-terminal domain-containing protein [Acidimicrobiales bacterium]
MPVGGNGDPLDEYRERRDFGRTPEPDASGDAAAGPSGPGGDGPRFVIQQHSATRLHWDLRLEHDGVLLSWALPRGVPWDPDENHLAVHTEDHPLEYLTFAGEIPEGSYGAGTMGIWDTGRYHPEKITDREVIVTLEGSRASGRYALFRTRGRDWMIHRMDPPVDPERRHLPDRFDLIEPGEGPPPGGDGWAVETLWRGQRAVLTGSGGSVELTTGEGTTLGERFPEVRRAGRALGMTEVALDGVLTAGDGGGGERVRRRLAARSESTWRRLARDAPVVFVAFDLLWLDGHATSPLAWSDRRQLLDELVFDGEAWSTPLAYVGDPGPLVEAAASSGVERLVAKRTDTPYDPALDPPPWHTFAVPGT